MSLRFKSEAEIPAHLLRRIDARKYAPEADRPKLLKFNNQKVEADGIKFDSKFEAKRYGELRLLEELGEISGLRVHVSFPLDVNGHRIGAIEPDFLYRKGGVTVIEDVKSKVTKTPLYEWKRAHFVAQYRMEIIEIERNKRRRAA